MQSSIRALLYDFSFFLVCKLYKFGLIVIQHIWTISDFWTVLILEV